jgi:hypothetical protein
MGSNCCRRKVVVLGEERVGEPLAASRFCGGRFGGVIGLLGSRMVELDVEDSPAMGWPRVRGMKYGLLPGRVGAKLGGQLDSDIGKAPRHNIPDPQG